MEPYPYFRPYTFIYNPAPRLRIIDVGPNKLHVLMYLRAHVHDFTTRPIAESKKRIETLPLEINYNRYLFAFAEQLRQELTSLGAKVEDIDDLRPRSQDLAMRSWK